MGQTVSDGVEDKSINICKAQEILSFLLEEHYNGEAKTHFQVGNIESCAASPQDC